MTSDSGGPAQHPESGRQIGFSTAASVIIANMVGTGVFTSLGFQVLGTREGFALLALWAVGGVVALCGALSYAELGAAYPHSGGEYVYLGKIYSPLLGFLGGWVSMTVGFAAPIALAALAFGRYVSVVTAVPPLLGSVLVLVVVAAVHASDLQLARRFQVGLTTLELALIAGFIVAGVAYQTPEPISFAPSVKAWREMAQPAFAVSLIYVSYAFSGWNAAGYIAGEIHRPSRNIPLALVSGTSLVAMLYLVLNWTFLRTIPLGQLGGVVEVGALSAKAMFGPAGGRFMSGMIAMLLVATISAMVLAGSRVTEAVSRDLARLSMIGARTARNVPRNAILLQVGITLALLLTNSVERVMTYAGFTLNLNTLLAVVGLFIVRRREPHRVLPYRTWGYPVVPLVFIVVSVWTLGFVLTERPLASLAGLATVAAGVAIYWWDSRGAKETMNSR
ncbi:MAG: amino acid permease [Gemmatimonadaceae bacterium]|nr:amino acid permease [Gemmatimonadaceae bacterium]